MSRLPDHDVHASEQTLDKMSQKNLVSICGAYDSCTFDIARAESRVELPFNSQIIHTRWVVHLFVRRKIQFNWMWKSKKVCFHLKWCKWTRIVWRKDFIVDSVAGWDENHDFWKDIAISFCFPQPSFFVRQWGSALFYCTVSTFLQWLETPL